jgi:hypothetical protein
MQRNSQQRKFERLIRRIERFTADHVPPTVDLNPANPLSAVPVKHDGQVSVATPGVRSDLDGVAFREPWIEGVSADAQLVGMWIGVIHGPQDTEPPDRSNFHCYSAGILEPEARDPFRDVSNVRRPALRRKADSPSMSDPRPGRV